MSWQDKLRKVKPYVAGEQPRLNNLIKLNTNENPYDPSPKVAEALKGLDWQKLRLYPPSNANALRLALSKYYQVDQENVFIGNGSDEVLALSFLAFFNSSLPILFPDLTYSFYPVYCDLYQIKYKTIPIDDEFQINLKDYYQDNGGIIFPNPNAPTGRLLSFPEIEELVANNPGSVVIVDEAYIDFGGTSVVPLVKKYDNLVVIQTYSKSRSLAGLRIGVALGGKEIIAKLYDIKNSFNSYPVDYIAQICALASIEDDQDKIKKCNKIIQTRNWLVAELRKLNFIVPDSYANFVFVKHKNKSGKEIFAALRKENIIVRRWDLPRIEDYLRITIGTDQEMEQLVDFLKNYL